MADKVTNIPPIESLVPHRHEALLIESIIKTSDESTICLVKLGSTSPYLVGDQIPSIVGLEYIAQTAAAYVGLADLQDGTNPRPGYLVSVQNATFDVASFHMTDVLISKVDITWSDGLAASLCRHCIQE